MKNSLRQQEREKHAECTSHWIHQGRVFSLRADDLEFDGEPPLHWEIVVHPGAVAVLPITDRGTLLLIEQWRRPVEQILIELPAGGLDPGESPREAAQRELQEEVGYKAGVLTEMGSIFTSPGICSERIHLFIAHQLTKSSLPGDHHEAIDSVELTLDEALDSIESGSIIDVKTICLILRYARRFH